MKKSLLVTAVVFAFASPALAGPKDKSQQPLIAIDSITGNAYVDNFVTAGKVKSKGCTFQLQLKDLNGLNDGDLILCIASADVKAAALPPSGAGNSVILAGEVKSAQLKIKGDMTNIGCGSTDAINWNGDVRCYLDDTTFRGSDNNTNWHKNCSDNGMIPLDNPFPKCVGGINDGNPCTDDPDCPGGECVQPQRLKVHSDVKVLIGLCQGLALGKRINPPTSAEIARQGSLVRTITP